MNSYYCPETKRRFDMKLTLADRFRMWKKSRQRRKELVWF